MHRKWKMKQPSYNKIKLKDNTESYQIKVRFYQPLVPLQLVQNHILFTDNNMKRYDHKKSQTNDDDCQYLKLNTEKFTSYCIIPGTKLDPRLVPACMPMHVHF